MRHSRSSLTPYLFISPWIVGFLAFTLGPLVFSLVMSFFDWPVTRAPSFIGLENYIKMFTADKQFYKSLWITFKFAAIFVPLNLAVALFLAMLLTQPVKGINFFRNVFYIPAVVSSVAVSIIWGWIFNSEYGVLNYLLSLLGIEGPKWLVDPKWAIVSVVIASAWGLGTMMLIFYTDIRGIPKDYYEAAAIDGATPLRQFFQHHDPRHHADHFVQPDHLDDHGLAATDAGPAADQGRTAQIDLFLRSVCLFQRVQAP